MRSVLQEARDDWIGDHCRKLRLSTMWRSVIETRECDLLICSLESEITM